MSDTTKARGAEAMAERIDICLSERVDGKGSSLSKPEEKPHGRLAWAIPVDFGLVVDLSVFGAHSEKDVCWHCRVVLEVPQHPPHCIDCPPFGDCDDPDCKADGCAEEADRD